MQHTHKKRHRFPNATTNTRFFFPRMKTQILFGKEKWKKKKSKSLVMPTIYRLWLFPIRSKWIYLNLKVWFDLICILHFEWQTIIDACIPRLVNLHRLSIQKRQRKTWIYVHFNIKLIQTHTFFPRQRSRKINIRPILYTLYLTLS